MRFLALRTRPVGPRDDGWLVRLSILIDTNGDEPAETGTVAVHRRSNWTADQLALQPWVGAHRPYFDS
jgi:hypothetical protein